jgi:hypothetical protein
MPMVVTLLFGSERLRTGAPDPVVVAEDTIAGMIDHCAKLGIDAGDVAALTILDLTARLCAYERAPLPVVLAALAAAVPAREAVLRDANARGVELPSLGTAKLAIAANACRLH